MSIYRKTGMPSRPGPYWITACRDGTAAPFYICDLNEFNVLGLLFETIGEAEAEMKKLEGLAWDGSVNDDYIASWFRK